MRPVSITHPDHFVNVARRRAAADPGAVFADQFENLSNLRAHLATGEEMWQQTGKRSMLVFSSDGVLFCDFFDSVRDSLTSEIAFGVNLLAQLGQGTGQCSGRRIAHTVALFSTCLGHLG